MQEFKCFLMEQSPMLTGDWLEDEDGVWRGLALFTQFFHSVMHYAEEVPGDAASFVGAHSEL